MLFLVRPLMDAADGSGYIVTCQSTGGLLGKRSWSFLSASCSLLGTLCIIPPFSSLYLAVYSDLFVAEVLPMKYSHWIFGEILVLLVTGQCLVRQWCYMFCGSLGLLWTNYSTMVVATSTWTTDCRRFSTFSRRMEMYAQSIASVPEFLHALFALEAL